MTPPSHSLPLLLDWGDHADTVCAVVLAATAVYVSWRRALYPLLGIMLVVPVLQSYGLLTPQSWFAVDILAFIFALYLHFAGANGAAIVAVFIGARLFVHVLPLSEAWWIATCNGLFIAANGAVAWRYWKDS